VIPQKKPRRGNTWALRKDDLGLGDVDRPDVRVIEDAFRRIDPNQRFGDIRHRGSRVGSPALLCRLIKISEGARIR
jgi:hypothetical protein